MTGAFDVLGIPVVATSFEAALASLASAPDEDRRIGVHFATAHMLVEASADARLAAALRADTVFPDGMPLVWVGRLRGQRVARVCGPDVMPALAARTAGRHGHFFYGGAPGVADTVAKRLSERNPGFHVAGTYSPPFRELRPEEDAEIVEMINASGAAFVWVGLGSPKQDLWVSDHRDRLDAAVLLAVGAAFDFVAGRTQRAPRWMQRGGLEWLFRLLSEPRRLLKRYTVVNTRFVWLLLRDAVRRRQRAPASPDERANRR